MISKIYLQNIFQWLSLFKISMAFFLCFNIAYATYPPTFSDCLQGDGEEYDQLDACQQLIRNNSKNYDLQVALVKTLDKRQKHEQAVIAYKKALVIFPGDSYFLKKLSIAESNLKEQQWLKNKKQGDVSSNNKTVASAVSIDFKLNKIRCLRLKGKKALDACNRAIKINNKDTVLFVSKGDIFASQRQNKQAIISYKKAVSLNPDDKKTAEKLYKLRQNQQRLKQEKLVKEAGKKQSVKPKTAVKTMAVVKTAPVKTLEAKTKDITLNPMQQQFIEQLNLLKSLKAKNIISQTEYEKRKMDLLDSISTITRATETANTNNIKAPLKKYNKASIKVDFSQLEATNQVDSKVPQIIVPQTHVEENTEDQVAEDTQTLKNIDFDPEKLPISFGNNWFLDKNKDSISKNTRCLLHSPEKIFNDGYTDTTISLQLSANTLLIKTKSSIDLSYPDTGIYIDQNKPFPLEKLFGDSSILIEENTQKITKKLLDGKKLTVKLGFWPTWPKTETHSIDFLLADFDEAYQFFLACEKL